MNFWHKTDLLFVSNSEFFNPSQQQSNEQGSPDLTLPQLPIVIEDIDPEDYDRPIEEDVTVGGQSGTLEKLSNQSCTTST